jgi:hypothetical protein
LLSTKKIPFQKGTILKFLIEHSILFTIISISELNFSTKKHECSVLKNKTETRTVYDIFLLNKAFSGDIQESRVN